MRVMRDLVGETLSDRYRIVTRLAGGGMGDVYKAHDLLLDRSVAVKILQPSLASDADVVARFRAEARAAARLSHPNVVSVYDWGSEDEITYYMVMEYVSGSDLRDLLVAYGALDSGQAVEIMVAACDALAAAHAQGLVHRDIKPENILISRGGQVKVADFGIAVIADADRTIPGGAIPGTLRYLSPEQAGGNEASAASDLWAAGAVLSELLTGLPPLQGAGSDLLQRRAVEEPMPPSSFDPSIPRELDRVVLRACAVDPADRYLDAGEMAGALRRTADRCLPPSVPVADLLDNVTGDIRLPDTGSTAFMPAPGRRRQRRPRLLGAAAAIAVMAIAGAGAVQAFEAISGPRTVPVPKLVGLSRAEAKQRALEDGLAAAVVDRIPDFDAPKGAVLQQFPQRGSLEEGKRIEIVISDGLPLARVPSLKGMALDKALVRLRAAVLTHGRVVKRYDEQPEGTVIGQRPARGELRWRSPVALFVSKGPRPIQVPELSGLALAEAKAALKDVGLAPVAVEVYSDAVRAGRVVSTSPDASLTAPEGSEVKIFVSIGPEFEKVRMPDVRNLSVAAARAKLEKLGLRVRVVRTQSCRGSTVAETDPIAGTTIRENDRVALFVC